MSAIITGEFIIFNSERHAIYDNIDNWYRFYVIYQSYLCTSETAVSYPIHGPALHNDDIGPSSQTSNIVATSESNDIQSPLKIPDFVLCQIWIPVSSPQLSFPDRSLVYLRGRLIIPPILEPMPINSTLTIYVETIYALFRKSVPSIHWTSALLAQSVRPDVTVIGKIIESWSTQDNTSYILVHISEDVSIDVDVMYIWYEFFQILGMNFKRLND